MFFENKYICIKKNNIVTVLCAVLFFIGCIIDTLTLRGTYKIILLIIGLSVIGLILINPHHMNHRTKYISYSLLYALGAFLLGFEYNFSRIFSEITTAESFIMPEYYTDSFGIILGAFQICTVLLIILICFSLFSEQYIKHRRIFSTLTCLLGFICFLYQPIYLEMKWGLLSGNYTKEYVLFAFICLFFFSVDITYKKTIMNIDT